MKVFGILCLVCILAVASSQHYNSYGNGDCSGDPVMKIEFNKCKEIMSGTYAKYTRSGDCKKNMKIEVQQYSDKDCETKKGDATESEYSGDVDKCIKSGSGNSTTSTKMDCSPASVTTFMPVMTA